MELNRAMEIIQTLVGFVRAWQVMDRKYQELHREFKNGQ